MNILGINDGHDAGVALLMDGKIIYAANEERFSRQKMAGGFPTQSLKNMLKYTSITPEQIDLICIGNTTKPTIPSESDDLDGKDRAKSVLKEGYYLLADKLPRIIKNRNIIIIHQKIGQAIRGKNAIIEKLTMQGYSNAEICFADHHMCHIYSSIGTAEFHECIAFSLDGGGDGLSGSVYYKKGSGIKKISEISKANSMGAFWAAVTEACGFNPHRHGGKITGLAALGTPVAVYEKIKKWYQLEGDPPIITNEVTVCYKKLVSKLKTLIDEHGMRDVAAGAQQLLEQVVTDWIKKYCLKIGTGNVALAGGIFANVRLNQAISELHEVDNVFVHPNMGDGGKAFGAAVYGYYSNDKTHDTLPRSSAYLGNKYSINNIGKALARHSLCFKKCQFIEYEIAKLLNQNKVVCRFNGRSEYGPRALGNRSILYHPKDISINDWLNKRLRRTEFMPFAPSVLKEYAEQCFFLPENISYTDHFMTRTFLCTNWFKNNCPAVVHVDGTARPQIVTKESNLSYYNIINEYRKLSGIPAVLNTSFNMHEEPIVETPLDAIRAFIEMGADYLAMSNYIIEKTV